MNLDEKIYSAARTTFLVTFLVAILLIVVIVVGKMLSTGYRDMRLHEQLSAKPAVQRMAQQNQNPKPAASPAVNPLTVEDLKACNRYATIFDPREMEAARRKQREKLEDEATRAEFADRGYIQMLYSNGGKLFVNKYQLVFIQPQDIPHAKIRIERTDAGFLVDCGARNITVFLDDKSGNPAGIEDLIPVVGQIRARIVK